MIFTISLPEQCCIMTNFLSVLERHGICSLGFAVGSWVASQEKERFLDAFVARGHLIGNHGYMHSSFNEMTLEQFEVDLLRAHKKISGWLHDRRFFVSLIYAWGPQVNARPKRIVSLKSTLISMYP
jgi:peptidoglycan/xylan/chitin deacetylase (PgdA/CDA1 family)